MSPERQAQWAGRLHRLQVLRDRFMRASRHDRAYRAYLDVQHLYDRWAEEVFHTTSAAAR